MVKLIHHLHQTLVVDFVRTILADQSTRVRVVGGAAITGLTFSLIVLALPLTFMRVHGFFDYEFANQHLFSIVSTLRFIGAISFLLLVYIVLRGVEFILARENKRVATAFRRLFVFGGTSGLLGLLAKYAIDGDIGKVVVVTAAALLTLLLMLRWYVVDALVSNYITALVGAVSLWLMFLFPQYVSSMYQQLALEPQGVSGFWVDIGSDDNDVKHVCLVALGPKTIWFNAGGKLVSISREGYQVLLPGVEDRRAARCETVPQSTAAPT